MDSIESKASRKVHSSSDSRKYNHTRYEPMRRFLRFLIRYIGFTLLVRLEKVEGLENIPETGPAILMINHIAFVDPFVVLHVVPRNIVPMAKVEALSYPIVGIFPKLWHVIPVRREEVDRRAIQQALEVLRAGEIILVAPEGTRHHELQTGKPGVAYLALRSGAPVIPVAVDGTPGFPTLRFLPRWHGPGVRVRFGRPFRFKEQYQQNGREHLRQMMDEALYMLAALLPPDRRGAYADLSKATQETIEWL